MRIGIFDSGLGGLLIAQSLIDRLPAYDYVYLGDTKRLPYGNRSQEAVHEFTVEAVDYLFQQDCAVVVVACNTASAEALKKIQGEYLPTHYPERRVLGVIAPTVEAAVQAGLPGRIGVMATASTVASGVYSLEIKKRSPESVVIESPAPLLVPLIEYGGLEWSQPILQNYLQPFLDKNITTLVLGCTHYAAIKKQVRDIATGVNVLSQDELVPESFQHYLERHPEIEATLSKSQNREYLVTDLNESTFQSEGVFSPVDIPLTKVHL